MPIELLSTGSTVPSISLDALTLPAQSYDSLLMPPRRVPVGMVSNNEVISANWIHALNDVPPATMPPPATTPPRVPDPLVVVNLTLDRAPDHVNDQALRDFLRQSDTFGEELTDVTPPVPVHDDPAVGPVMNLESAHTDQGFFKQSDLPKHSINQVLDKMAAAMAKWEEQHNKALSQVQTTPDLTSGFGRLPLMPMPDPTHGSNQIGANASHAPVSQPLQNLATVTMLLQSQIAAQKMAGAAAEFWDALEKGNVSVKPIGSQGPFVPLAPPSYLPVAPPLHGLPTML